MGFEHFRNGKLAEVKRKHGPVGVVMIILAGFVFISFFAFLFGYLVKFLWNYTIADIFNLSEITYLQAVALLILARLLTGCGPKHPHPNEKIRTKYCKDYKEYWKEDGKMSVDKFVDNTISDKKGE